MSVSLNSKLDNDNLKYDLLHCNAELISKSRSLAAKQHTRIHMHIQQVLSIHEASRNYLEAYRRRTYFSCPMREYGKSRSFCITGSILSAMLSSARTFYVMKPHPNVYHDKHTYSPDYDGSRTRRHQMIV